jgi:hypothetical protein
MLSEQVELKASERVAVKKMEKIALSLVHDYFIY